MARFLLGCVFLATALIFTTYANECTYTEVPTSVLESDPQTRIISREGDSLARPNTTILWSITIAYGDNPFLKEFSLDPCGDLRHEIDIKSSKWAPGTVWPKSTCDIQREDTALGRSTGELKLIVNELGTMGLDKNEMTRTLQELLGVRVDCQRKTKAQRTAMARVQEILEWLKKAVKCSAGGTGNGNAQDDSDEQVAAHNLELQNPREGTEAVSELKIRKEKMQKKSKLRRVTRHSTEEFEDVNLNEEEQDLSLDTTVSTGGGSCDSTEASESMQSECQETKQTTSSQSWSEKWWAWLTSLGSGTAQKNSKENEKGEKNNDYEMQEWNGDRYGNEVDPDTGNTVSTIPVPYQA